MPRALRTVRRVSARLAMRPVLGVATLALLGACGHQATVETGLNTDLALADQLQHRNTPALVSVQELSPSAMAPAPDVTHEAAPAPVVHTRVVTTRVVTRTIERAPAARPAAVPAAPSTRAPAANVDRTMDGEVVASGPTAGRAASTERASADRDGTYDAGTYRADAETAAPSAVVNAPISRQPQAHTARDGAFGSIAGAILGAAVSHGDRVRGGIIGAVAGGALGAIYGHSVDRTYAGVQSAYPTYRSYSGYPRTPRYRGTI